MTVSLLDCVGRNSQLKGLMPIYARLESLLFSGAFGEKCPTQQSETIATIRAINFNPRALGKLSNAEYELWEKTFSNTKNERPFSAFRVMICSLHFCVAKVFRLPILKTMFRFKLQVFLVLDCKDLCPEIDPGQVKKCTIARCICILDPCYPNCDVIRFCTSPLDVEFI